MKKFGLGLALAILIQTLAGVTTLAADAVRVEAENFVNTENTGKILPGGTGKTLSAASGQESEHIFDVAQDGIYSIYVYGATIAETTFNMYADGVLVPTAAVPALSTDWTVYAETKIADIRLSAGEHRMKFEYGVSFAFDYFELREQILDKSNVISATLYDDTSASETDNGLAVSDGGYATYLLKSSAQNVYTLNINAASVSDNAKLEISLNDEVVKIMSVKNTFAEDSFSEYFAVNISIPEGENKITFALNGGDMVFKSFSLNEFNADDALSTWQRVRCNATEYMPGGQDVGYHDSTPDSLDQSYFKQEYFPVDVWNASHGLIVYTATTEWYKFERTIPEAGDYDVYIHLVSPVSFGISVTTEDGTTKKLSGVTTGGWDDYTEKLAGTVSLQAGKQVIQINIEEGYGNITYYEFVKRPSQPELYAMFADNTVLTQGTEIKRGTEKITAYFTDYLNEKSNVNVKLTDGENTIPVSCEIADNMITMTLLSSLRYETEYTIQISGLSSTGGGTYNQDIPLSFKTGTSDGDSGSGKFVSADVKIDGNTFTITGAVSTSNGIQMSGRGVYATFKNGTTYTSDTLYSTENGKFILTYTLPEDAPEGEYAITVFTDYASRSDRVKSNIIYVSKDSENAILNGINDATSWEDVKTVIENENYYTMLALSGKSYVKKLDNERFYKHFMNRNYKDKETLIADYNKFLAFERINQEKSKLSTLKTLLKNESNCEYLGIERGKLLLLVKTADEFYNEVFSMDLYDDADEFAKTINTMLNAYLVKEYEIQTPELLAQNVSVYVGKAADISVELKDKPENVHKIIYAIECPSEDAAADIDTKELTAEKDGKIIYITSDNADEITVAFSNGTAGKYEFKVSAVVEYSVGDSETCTLEAAQIPFTAEVKRNSSNGTSGSGGGSSGGGKTSFSPVVVPTTPTTPTEPTEPAEDKFTGFADMKDAAWAEENVNRLVEKNVISKADNFRPNDYITREEFVKMVVTAFDLYDETATADFTDVTADAWYAPYIASAYARGIVTGNPDGTFGVGRNITRQEMAVILGRILNTQLSGEISDTFADDSTIADWAKASVYEMKKRGIINGVGENMFEPESYATRAMAARMIDFMMNEVAK